jgi:hypothetical protein
LALRTRGMTQIVHSAQSHFTLQSSSIQIQPRQPQINCSSNSAHRSPLTPNPTSNCITPPESKQTRYQNHRSGTDTMLSTNITITGCGLPTIYIENNCNSYSRRYSSDSYYSYESLLTRSCTHCLSSVWLAFRPRTNVSFEGVGFTPISTNQPQTPFNPRAKSKSKPSAQPEHPGSRLIKTRNKTTMKEIKNMQTQLSKSAKEQ